MGIKISKINIHIISWSIFAFLTVFNPLNPSYIQHGILLTLLKSTIHLGIILSAFYFTFSYVVPKTLLLKKKIKRFILYCVFMLIVYWLLSYMAFSIFKQHSLDEESKAGLLISIIFEPIIFITSGTMIRLSAEYYETKTNYLEMAQQMTLTELSFLRSQISPHFLFNTLNNIYALVLTKSDEAPQIVLKLSEIMRYMLHDANNARVTLAEEVEFLKSFISLQKIRLADSNSVKADFNLATEDCLIAPLLLIPFVENAFKHGNFSGSEAVSIKLNADTKKLTFEVKNKINFLTKDSTSGIGLKNLRRRLELIYPEKYSLVNTENNNIYYSKLEVILE